MIDFEKTRRGIQRRDFDIEAAIEEEKEEIDAEIDEARADGDEEEQEEERVPKRTESGTDEDERVPENGDSGTDGDEEEKEESRSAASSGRGCIVEGYAATFNSPYQLYRGGGASLFERVDARAFDGAEMRDVILQYDHGGRVYARQSNGTLEITPDARGLHIRADLSGTEEGRKLYEEIRGGYTTKMSLSFTIDDETTEELPEEEVVGFRTGSPDRFFLRTIRKIGRVYDVSAVSLPANEGTEIAARSVEPDRERSRLAFNIAFEMAK